MPDSSELHFSLSNSPSHGYSVTEFDDILHVCVKESLITLFKRTSLWRKRIAGVYVYFSTRLDVQAKQVIRRREYMYDQNYKSGKVEDELKAAIVLFSSLLSEHRFS